MTEKELDMWNLSNIDIHHHDGRLLEDERTAERRTKDEVFRSITKEQLDRWNQICDDISSDDPRDKNHTTLEERVLSLNRS